VTRFWFFSRGGTVLVATAECGGPGAARRLALDYNREPGPLGRVDLIADASIIGEATIQISLEAAPTQLPPVDRAGDE
jgi:hypothetical protein